jgi:hypothetical protein
LIKTIMTLRISSTARCLAVVLTGSTLGHAEPRFATPPDEDAAADDSHDARHDEPPVHLDDSGTHAEHADAQESALRVSTGPVLRATSDHADGGFGAAIDLGSSAAGVRFTGNWVGVGGARGLAQYDAQLWLDFGATQRLHPIIAAGAGRAQLDMADAQGVVHDRAVGVGTLRATLEYALPIRDADARAGLDVEGVLPTIVGQSSAQMGDWLLLTARIGVGF